MRFRLPVKIKMKMFHVTIVVISVYLFLFYLLIEIWFHKSRTKEDVDTSVDVPFVIVHLDLKGAAPKLEYLESLLPIMKKYGANGLLIEYEDMFPYEGKLVNLSATYAYHKPELKSFITRAVDLGFEIIPLVQTFGHLEFALKLKQFHHLREDPLYPDSICPSKIESTAFIRHMLEQVIKFHNEIKPLNYIHIGCDEVFHVKKCDRCRQRKETAMEIFLQHVKKTSEVVKTISPNTTVLIWDDILQTRNTLLLSPLELNVEPVSWCYKPEIDVSVVNFYNYPPNFQNIWLASAFKGADGRTSVIPDIKDRFLNNLNWMKLILEYTFVKESVFVRRTFNFKGIILTGWSRYSHMDSLCDILPAAIPSLIINLVLVSKIKSGVNWNNLNKDWLKLYNEDIKTDVDGYFGCDITDADDEECKGEEILLHRLLKEYVTLKKEIDELFYNGRDNLSALDYYFKLGFINRNNVNDYYFKCHKSLNKLIELEKSLAGNLTMFYEKHVIEEYVTSLSYYYQKLLRNTMINFERFTQIQYWDKRTDVVIEH